MNRYASVFLVVSFISLFGSGECIAQEVETRLSAEQLFQPDHIVEVEIEVSQQDWDTIRLQSRNIATALEKKPAESPFTYVKGNVTIDGVLIKNVGIRKKGFVGSLSEDRPSLKIKFSEYQDQDPVEGISRLTLNNNNQDPTRICQYLSYRMFRDSGTVASRCNFAKVTVNGEYLGIYSNVESIRKPMLERGFGDGSGALFEGTVTDFLVDWVDKFEKKNKPAKTSYIRKIAELVDADEAVDIEKLDKRMDIDAFISFWAMESLIGFWDGYCNNQNNFFVYRNPDDKKMYFIPWGTDSAFTERMPLPPFRVRPRSVHCQAILPNRLYRVPEIRNRYQERLMTFLDEHWNEEQLLAELDQLEAMLKDHLLDEDSFSSAMRTYRRFVKKRRERILEDFEDGAPKLLAMHRQPAYFVEVGTARVDFSTEWFDKTPEDGSTVGQVELELIMNGQVVEFENVGAFAETSKWPSPGGQQPPSIQIVGVRKSDGKKLTLATGVSIEAFQADKDDVEVGGIYMVGQQFMNSEGRMVIIGGQASFDQAEMKTGETVQGSMKLTIREMRGGKPRDDEASAAPDADEDKKDDN